MANDNPFAQYATPSADQNPFAKYAKPAPKAFVPTSAFDADMDRTVGKGRWKPTGDYRSPAREGQLRAQGAGTVPPGHTSAHSLGTPDAPGAHDFVPAGDWNAALAAARREPGVKDAFIEGAQGGQGRHIHVDMTDESGNPFLKYATPVATPKPSPVPAPAKLTARPAQPPAKPQEGNPFSKFLGGVGKELLDSFTAPVKEAYQGQVSANKQLGADIMRRIKPKTTQDLERNNAPSAFGLPSDIGMDLLNVAGGGAVTGAAHGLVGRPVQTTTGSKTAGDVTTSLVAAALPFAGEANEALAASRFAKQAGVDIDTARLAIQNAKAARVNIAEPKTEKERPTTRTADLTPATKRRAIPATRDHPAEPAVTQSRVVGEEPKPATRTANALYRLQGSNTADKIEMQQFRRDLPAEIKDPATKEALYHALEAKLVDPKAEIPEELKPAYTALQPYLAEQTAGINELRQLADPKVDDYLEDSGYVHRIKEGEPNLMEPEGGAPRSPFQTRKSLTTRPDSARARKFVVLQDPETGERIFLRGQDEEKNPYAELKPGMTFRPAGEAPAGMRDKVFKVVQPTTKEIEAHTRVRYQKDAIDNTLANVMQIRRALRNKEVLDLTLQDMKERGVAHRETWHYRDEDGGLQMGGKPGSAPRGFVSLHDNPHTQGWKFDPNDAQVQELKDWLPKREEDWLQSMDRFNNFALRSNFLSPFIHPKNIAEFWGASRGWDWFTPQGYAGLARTAPKALREVMTMGPAYKQYLREGSALLSGDARTNKFTELLTDKAGSEIVNDPKTFDAIKDAVKIPGLTAAKLYTSFQEASHKMMWMVSDMMMMQRVMELQEKGMPIRDAIAKAEEMIPNYRVPAQIMDSPTGGRMLHHMFANNRLFSVGRFHYNKAAAWGRMAAKIAKGTPEERTEALGQLLAIGTIAGAIVPLFNKAIQLASGNKNARVKQGGVTSYIQSGQDLASGREDPAQAIASIIDLSPEASLAQQEISQRDYFGRDLWNKFGSTPGNVAREVENPLDQFGPYAQSMEALSPTYGPGRVLARQVGVELPQNAPGAVRSSTAKRLRSAARKQERKDPIAMGLENISRGLQ